MFKKLTLLLAALVAIFVITVGINTAHDRLGNPKKAREAKLQQEDAERHSALSQIDTATAFFENSEAVSIVVEAKRDVLCHLHNEAGKNIQTLKKIWALKPPPTEEEEKRYMFSTTGIKERGRQIESTLSRRFYEIVKKKQSVGGCKDTYHDIFLDEVMFFETLATYMENGLDENPEIAARRVRDAFKDLLRRKVREVKERARLEYAAGKVGDKAFFRQKLSDLEEKGAEWKFTQEELGIEPHLLNHPETKPLG